jgi:hypothetical protein
LLLLLLLLSTHSYYRTLTAQFLLWATVLKQDYVSTPASLSKGNIRGSRSQFGDFENEDAGF